MKRVLASLIMVVLMGALVAHGDALTAARDTPSRSGNFVSLGVYTNTRIFAGSMVAINASGYAVAASDATALNVIGAATETVDNRTNADGAGDSGAKTIEVARGVFRWVNGDTFTDADIGDLAFVEDDQTVQKAASATYDIIAGVILDVDADGVWVDTYDIGAQGTAAPTTLDVSGNATVGGTLGVTGNTTIGASKVVITAASGNILSKGTIGAGANGTEFTVSSAGNVAAAGTLGVTGASTLSALTVNGEVTSTNGVFKITNLPTATNGLAVGQLWNSSGTIKVFTE